MNGLIPQLHLEYWVPKEQFKDSELNLLAAVSTSSQLEGQTISLCITPSICSSDRKGRYMFGAQTSDAEII